jgi:hypothetical protein
MAEIADPVTSGNMAIRKSLNRLGNIFAVWKVQVLYIRWHAIGRLNNFEDFFDIWWMALLKLAYDFRFRVDFKPQICSKLKKMTENNPNRQSFRVKDCTLIVRMGGVEPALNLREFGERIKICPPECLYHHFNETLIRPSFDYPGFRNDFAVWCFQSLRDRVLAERLGIINPHAFPDLEELRAKLIDIISERLDEVHYIPWVEKSDAFRFLRAATIVFDTGVDLHDFKDFIDQLPNMSTSSIYYHFIEARRRTEDKTDDFTAWMKKLEETPESLIKALENIDFYFLNLTELKNTLIHVAKHFKEAADNYA